jgi:hypothetical protein
MKEGGKEIHTTVMCDVEMQYCYCTIYGRDSTEETSFSSRVCERHLPNFEFSSVCWRAADMTHSLSVKESAVMSDTYTDINTVNKTHHRL